LVFGLLSVVTDIAFQQAGTFRGPSLGSKKIQ
jgi:hypothetical protein